MLYLHEIDRLCHPLGLIPSPPVRTARGDAQNPQSGLQIFPRIIKVAVFLPPSIHPYWDQIAAFADRM